MTQAKWPTYRVGAVTEAVKAYQCPTCGLQTASAYALKQHAKRTGHIPR